MLPLPELLVSAQADGAALTNSVSQTSILPTAARAVVAANVLDRIGKRLHLKATGRISTLVTTPGTLLFEVKLGSVVIASSGLLTLNVVAKVNVGWKLDWDMTLRAIGTGTAANFMHQGLWTSEAVIGNPLPTVGGSASHVLPYNTAPVVGTGFDSTAAAILDLFATWSSASASNSIQLHQYDVLIKN